MPVGQKGLVDSCEDQLVEATVSLATRVTVTAHSVDVSVADSLGIPHGGALLLRPDGRQVLEWTGLDALHDGNSLPREFRRQEVV